MPFALQKIPGKICDSITEETQKNRLKKIYRAMDKETG